MLHYISIVSGKLDKSHFRKNYVNCDFILSFVAVLFE